MFSLTKAVALRASLAGAGVLLILLFVQTMRLHTAHADVATAQAAQATAEARLTGAKAEKATLTAAIGTAEDARASAENVATERLAIIEAERADHRRIVDANTRAVRTARDAQADAERTLSVFMDRYADAIRNPGCSTALIHMEASCSALSDY